MRRLLRRLKGRLDLALASDDTFIETAYFEILGRPPDADGLNHYRRVLKDGTGRTAVLLEIMRSDEFGSTLERKAVFRLMPNLQEQRPDRYGQTIDRTNGTQITVFRVESPADFDWLESAILEYGYYEKPGVWNLDIDTDKRVVAEIIAAFAPRRALELGCAAGAVLQCLDDAGIAAEGVEISSMAMAKAPPGVRERIHRGDLLTLELPTEYDMLFGLDVFEHLNPNRLDAYLSRLDRIATPGAFVFANIPAFGEDPVFGTVFPLYVDGWEQDAARRRPFTRIHVDESGYPIHGHLTWADARWWTERFVAHGFTREPEIERPLHEKYDSYMLRHAPARRSYFVFSKAATADRRRQAIHAIRSTRSAILDSRSD